MLRKQISSGALPTAALMRIGRLAKERARTAFEAQARGGVAWPARAVPNVMGILRDAETSSTPKGRRFDARPAAIDTGSLRNSIQVSVTGPSSIEVGSALPYASIVQRGGASTIQVTQTMRENVKRMVRRDPRVAASPRLRGVANGTTSAITAQVPPRPFLTVTEQDRKDYRSILEDEIHRVVRGGS